MSARTSSAVLTAVASDTVPTRSRYVSGAPADTSPRIVRTGVKRKVLGAGLEVVGFDIDSAKGKTLAVLGGRPVSSITGLYARYGGVTRCNYVVQMVHPIIRRS